MSNGLELYLKTAHPKMLAWRNALTAAWLKFDAAITDPYDKLLAGHLTDPEYDFIYRQANRELEKELKKAEDLKP